MTTVQYEKYYDLIDDILRCPAGQEPDVLEQRPDLLDAGLVVTLIQVATSMAHNNQQDSAKCLVHVARELAKELGLYPKT
mgnify:FL=1|jgi:hypothetical protein